jgi:hypothetical protein
MLIQVIRDPMVVKRMDKKVIKIQGCVSGSVLDREQDPGGQKL